VTAAFRPHVLGIDDAPFDKFKDTSVPLVAVLTEGPDLVEAVAVTRFPIDGDDAAEFLAEWVGGLRFAAALHAVVLGGLTLAGLGVVDLEHLARRIGAPAIAVNRRDPRDPPLVAALSAAGLERRIPLVESAPAAWAFEPGVFVTHAGAERAQVERILQAVRGKSKLPEPLRLAHLIGAALVTGQSHGRV
jgi:uncharacterized protein